MNNKNEQITNQEVKEQMTNNQENGINNNEIKHYNGPQNDEEYQKQVREIEKKYVEVMNNGSNDLREELTPKMDDELKFLSSKYEMYKNEMLSNYFGCETEDFNSALEKATEKILQGKEGEEKKHLQNLISQSLNHILKNQNVIAEAEKKGEDKTRTLVHGTGSGNVYGIIKALGLTPGGDITSGGSDNLSGQKNKEVSLAEIHPHGYAVSYGYARDFEGESTDKNLLSIDANDTNQSTELLEMWDSLTDVEKEKFDKNNRDLGGLPIDREMLENSAHGMKYFNYPLRKKEADLYTKLIKKLKESGSIPDFPEDTEPIEYPHKINDMDDQEMLNHLLAHIVRGGKKWQKKPDLDKSEISIDYWIDEYNKKINTINRQLSAYREGLTDEELNEKIAESHKQYPVIFYIDRDKIKGEMTKIRPEDNLKPGLPWHPSEKEVRATGVDLDAMTGIQIPEKKIPEIQQLIDERIQVTDLNNVKARQKLESLRENLIPMELFEVERVLRNEINKL